MIRGLHHVAIVTQNLDSLASFYCDAMGFRPAFETGWSNSPEMDQLVGVANSEARVVMLRGPGFNLEIFEYSEVVEAEAPSCRAANHPGFAHICFGVGDLDTAIAELSTRGMSFNAHPVGAPDGSVKASYGRDPDGNIIELVQVSLNADEWKLRSNSMNEPEFEHPAKS